MVSYKVTEQKFWLQYTQSQSTALFFCIQNKQQTPTQRVQLMSSGSIEKQHGAVMA